MVGGRVIVMKKILGTLIFSMLFCVNVFAEVKTYDGRSEIPEEATRAPSGIQLQETRELQNDGQDAEMQPRADRAMHNSGSSS